MCVIKVCIYIYMYKCIKAKLFSIRLARKFFRLFSSKMSIYFKKFIFTKLV